MKKLTVFNLVTLDGYFAGQGGDISWHTVDEEFQELAKEASNSGNTLLFGRVTYETHGRLLADPGSDQERSYRGPGHE